MTEYTNVNEIKKPEVLAPAGTFEALKAAVKAGADAVYVGGSMFSARAFAGNFDREEMLEAIDYCHLFGVRLYIALNTLLKNDEICEVPDYVRPFYQAGADGMIIQDMGVAKVIKKEFPLLPIHASTQMSISSAAGAKFLKEAGFTRVVPARELTLEETRKIKQEVDIEIESFVHGAMCFAYSGKCLLSSFIGGRSGNRGRCAQPCRQCYKVWESCSIGHGMDGAGMRDAGPAYRGALRTKAFVCEEYAMSMKDMCTLPILPKLIEAGIDSFKIEGRMKKPEYVAATVSAYRMAVDMYAGGNWNEQAIAEAVRDMKDIYNRGGFTDGYYLRESGPEMMSSTRPNHTGLFVGTVSRVSPPDVFVRLTEDVNAQDVLEIRSGAGQGKTENIVELTSAKDASAGTELILKGKDFKKIRPGSSVFRTRNNKLIGHINEDIVGREMAVRAIALVEAHVGRPLSVSIWNDDASASIGGKVVERAESRPVSTETILEKMKKTGGSGVHLDASVNMDADAFVVMSELNNLRREAVTQFKIALLKRQRRK